MESRIYLMQLDLPATTKILQVKENILFCVIVSSILAYLYFKLLEGQIRARRKKTQDIIIRKGYTNTKMHFTFT